MCYMLVLSRIRFVGCYATYYLVNASVFARYSPLTTGMMMIVMMIATTTAGHHFTSVFLKSVRIAMDYNSE